jgi:beta-galactosidase
MDGLLFSDHTPTPGLHEYKKAIEPVQVVSLTGPDITIINRYDHITLNHLTCEWSIIGGKNSRPTKEVPIPRGLFDQPRIEPMFSTNSVPDIQPGATAKLKIEELQDSPWLSFDEPHTEYLVELKFTLRDSTAWAEAGHEVAFGQLQLTQPPDFRILKELKSPIAPNCIQTSPQVLEISGQNNVWKFSIADGSLTSWRKSGTEIIHTPLDLGFYRALTDNDRPSFGHSWLDSRLHQANGHFRSTTWSSNSDCVTVMVTSRIAPSVFEWSVDTTFTYTFTSEHVSVKVSGVPRGNKLPSTFSRIGLTLSLNSITKATWWGRGPGESYRDKKLSQKIGKYSAPIDDLFTDYEFPQETGNRTDVRWVEFVGAGPSLKASFGPLEGASFSALHYTTADLDDCRHPYELHKRKKEETIVRLDWAHHGLGTGSCGPATLPKYELKSERFEY